MWQTLKNLFDNLLGKSTKGNTRRQFLTTLPALFIAPKVVSALLKNIGPDNFTRVGNDLGDEWKTLYDFRVPPVTGYGYSYLMPGDIKDTIAKMVARQEFEVHPTHIIISPVGELYLNQLREEWKLDLMHTMKMSPNRWPR